MADKDTALAVLQGALAIAGLLLIFAGYLQTKAAAFDSTVRRDKFRWLALIALIPLCFSLFCCFASVYVVLGSPWAATHLLGMLEILLATTGVYAIVALIAAG
ncbi:MAG: hypothetical protein ACRD3S_20290 [Terracidiphilus sp.]